MPPPPPGRTDGRNAHWPHVYNADIISMPDEWEYPWYAAWDLAFHMIPLALVDPDFAKEQLLLFCREWYMHPNGQLPAYEWAFDDVNPPVHAWAAWRVFKIDAIDRGEPDWDFLERIFQKLLMNFSWWVNRKDAEGNNLLRRRLSRAGQHRTVRSVAPASERTRPSNNPTPRPGWRCTASTCSRWPSNSRITIRRTRTCARSSSSTSSRSVSAATERSGYSLWDEDDGFFYDVLVNQDGDRLPAESPLDRRTHSIVRGRDLRPPSGREPSGVPSAGSLVHPQAARAVPQLPRGRLRRRARASLPLTGRPRSTAPDPDADARRGRVPVTARLAVGLEGPRARARPPRPQRGVIRGPLPTRRLGHVRCSGATRTGEARSGSRSTT